MTLDDLIRASIEESGSYQASPDLFARVTRSIEADVVHRRRVRGWIAGVAGFLALLTTALVAVIHIEDGVAVVAPNAFEAIETAVLIVIVMALGPLLRRFGRILVDSVFRAHRPTGGHFLRLLDVAFYLVFGGYIFVTAQFDAGGGVVPIVSLLEIPGLFRVAGMLLLMGLLHAVTIVAVPVIGLIFTSAWHHGDPDVDDRLDPSLARIERSVGIVMWLAVAVGAVIAVLVAFDLVVGMSNM